MRKRRRVAGRERGKRKAWKKKKYLFLIVCEYGVLVFKYCVT